MADPNFSIVAHVDVDQTPLSGARNSGSSAWSSIEAPPEYVINKDKVQFAWTHDATEEWNEKKWENPVEIIPGSGIEQPRKLSIQVGCYSKHGALSGGAWADLKATGVFSKYTR
jgi:hypothetical protein